MNNTDICNMALAYLAKGRISSIDENNELARQCKLFYDHSRKGLLREYSWGFAKRIIRLAELDTSNPDWKYVYAYPEKCVCARRIFNEKETVNSLDKDKYDLFLISDNTQAIGCDVYQAYLEYTYDAEDAELFSSDFVEALARMLAFNICLQLNGNGTIQQTQYQLAQAALNRAKYTTAAERQDKLDYPDKYFTARM